MNQAYNRQFKIALDAAKYAGALLRAEFHRPGGARGQGSHADIDEEVEHVIRKRLTDAFPNYGCVGEELPEQDRKPKDADSHVWCIDPHDGTKSFLQGHRGSSVSIALLRNGVPVLGVVFAFSAPDDDGDMIAWAEGCGPVTRNGQPIPPRKWASELRYEQTVLLSVDADKTSEANAECVAPARFRCMASLAYRLALVAVGEAEVAVSLHSPVTWDFAAGHALLRAAGGELVNGQGQPICYTHDGHSSSSGAVFGGSAQVGSVLARRDWQSVLLRAEKPEPYTLALPVPGELIADAGVLSRAQACLIAQVAADNAGSMCEFVSRDEIRRRYPKGVRRLENGGTFDLIAGQPTDDSELCLAGARAIVEAGRFDEEITAKCYLDWLQSKPFDCGITIRQALSSGVNASGKRLAQKLRAASSKTSQSNGSLMRAAYLGIYGVPLSPGKLAEIAKADAALTHAHPVAKDANAIFVLAVAHAISTGADAKSVHEFALRWAIENGYEASVCQALKDAVTKPPVDFEINKGWVLIALQNAFFQLLHSPTLEDAVANTISQGGDTDTTACIAASLFAAVRGRESVPAQWQDRVLTCRPMKGLPGVHRPRPRTYWPVDTLVLAERLLIAGRKAVANEPK